MSNIVVSTNIIHRAKELFDENCTTMVKDAPVNDLMRSGAAKYPMATAIAITEQIEKELYLRIPGKRDEFISGIADAIEHCMNWYLQ